MTPPLTLQPDFPMKPTAAAETTSTQLFGALYITLTGLMDSMVPNSGPWSLLGRFLSYFIKLASILWWELPTVPSHWIPLTTPGFLKLPSVAYSSLFFPKTSCRNLKWLLVHMDFGACPALVTLKSAKQVSPKSKAKTTPTKAIKAKNIPFKQSSK
ncbi:hypothetical protein DSO57_1034036 [Entomophthora muscae]|uniref:Uncharacterized protein n=1 Tax=Entomophthora muscae TaxID=34485 RepID=A0ACC2TAV3_9FUNG|nr:hypothetical protein DSO57_1034036 [Entomophthora muscae]